MEVCAFRVCNDFYRSIISHDFPRINIKDNLERLVKILAPCIQRRRDSAIAKRLVHQPLVPSNQSSLIAVAAARSAQSRRGHDSRRYRGGTLAAFQLEENKLRTREGRGVCVEVRRRKGRGSGRPGRPVERAKIIGTKEEGEEERVKAYIGGDRPSRISKQCDERAR